MKNVYNFGKILELSEVLEFVNIANNLETFYAVYGSTPDLPNYPCWMEYQNINKLGAIAFSRKTHLHPILHEMVKIIFYKFQGLFPKNFPIYEERIHFLRTRGSIPIHRDEAGRKSCINIGVKNSNIATTRFSLDGIYENFDKSNESINLEDGYAYLINTGTFHCVQSSLNEPRYLITYGFQTDFETLKKLFIETHK